jgi:hypothetical protein
MHLQPKSFAATAPLSLIGSLRSPAPLLSLLRPQR